MYLSLIWIRDSLRESISLKEKQILTKKYEINESDVQIQTVHISADRQAMKSDVKVSVTSSKKT